MKLFIKHSLRILLFLLIGLLIVHTLSFFFLPSHRYESPSQRYFGLYWEKPDSIDVLLTGDSVSYCTFSPMILWEKYGITSFHCSNAGQTVDITLENLQKALRIQSPRLILLDTSHLFSEITLEHLIHSRMRAVSPLFDNHDVWKYVSASELIHPDGTRYIDDYKGGFNGFKVEPRPDAPYMVPGNDICSLPQSSLYLFDRIVRLCEKEQIPLVLCNAPQGLNWDYAHHNAIQALADQYGLVYIDLNLHTEEMDFNWAEHTGDHGEHLNYEGSLRATKYLGQWLRDNYDLPDHRQDPSYQEWDHSLTIYKNNVENKISNSKIELRPVAD